MGLYTFLYENLLYRLYIIHIQPPLLVTARLSRYTAHTAHTAIQPYTPYIIQRYTASLWRLAPIRAQFTCPTTDLPLLMRTSVRDQLCMAQWRAMAIIWAGAACHSAVVPSSAKLREPPRPPWPRLAFLWLCWQCGAANGEWRMAKGLM